jgi:uncharacterized membrane protein
MNRSEKELDLKSLAQIAMMAAIIFVAISIIKIPSGTGYVNLGDSMVFVGAIILGGKRGAAAAGIGGFLSDLLGGYPIYSPFTLVIKAVMALIVGAIILTYKGKLNFIVLGTLSFIVAGIWEVIAYLGADIIVYTLTMSPILKSALTASLLNIPGNLVQATVGIIIAVPIAVLLKKSGVFHTAKSTLN